MASKSLEMEIRVCANVDSLFSGLEWHMDLGGRKGKVKHKQLFAQISLEVSWCGAIRMSVLRRGLNWAELTLLLLPSALVLQAGNSSNEISRPKCIAPYWNFLRKSRGVWKSSGRQSFQELGDAVSACRLTSRGNGLSAISFLFISSCWKLAKSLHLYASPCPFFFHFSIDVVNSFPYHILNQCIKYYLKRAFSPT